MNITVYLGASNGNDQNLILAARKLGKWIGENGHTLVYGGSKCGLMGELAESVLKAKGCFYCFSRRNRNFRRDYRSHV